eukprot:1613706-Rhodomonas_salina.1
MAHRWWKYRVLFEPVYTSKGVKPYKLKVDAAVLGATPLGIRVCGIRASDPPANVVAGAVEGQNRGPNPMNPPVVMQDEL